MTVNFTVEVYSLTATSLVELEYGIWQNNSHSLTYEFAPFKSTYNTQSLRYSIAKVGETPTLPHWLSHTDNYIKIGTNDNSDAGEYFFIVEGDLGDWNFYPSNTTRAQVTLNITLYVNSSTGDDTNTDA